jgi:hypothetical protein
MYAMLNLSSPAYSSLANLTSKNSEIAMGPGDRHVEQQQKFRFFRNYSGCEIFPPA